MPRISKRETGLKILEAMLTLGIAVGAFSYIFLSDKTNYLAYIALFSTFGFLSYVSLQRNMKMNFWIFILNFATATTFALVLYIPVEQFTEGLFHTLSIVFFIVLLALGIVIADSYKKEDKKRVRKK